MVEKIVQSCNPINAFILLESKQSYIVGNKTIMSFGYTLLSPSESFPSRLMA